MYSWNERPIEYSGPFGGLIFNLLPLIDTHYGHIVKHINSIEMSNYNHSFHWYVATHSYRNDSSAKKFGLEIRSHRFVWMQLLTDALNFVI